MLNMGIIKGSNSLWTSPVVMVPKKDVTISLCVDYRRFNTIIVPGHILCPELMNVRRSRQGKIFRNSIPNKRILTNPNR